MILAKIYFLKTKNKELDMYNVGTIYNIEEYIKYTFYFFLFSD